MTTVTVQPSVSGDDGSWHNEGVGSFSITQTNVTVGDSDSANFNRWAFIRFPGVNVPKGATLTSATLAPRAGGLTGTIPALTIAGNAIDNAVAPTTRSGANALVHTSASVAWTPSEWVTNTRYTSPNIKTVIEEITNRAGWVSGNAIILFLKVPVGDAFSSANLVSFNGVDGGVPANTAELSVTWLEAGGAMDGRGLTYHMNRKANTLVNGMPTLEATGAANVWAGTTGMEITGALNVKAGNTVTNARELVGVLNQLAGTTALEADAAAASIP